MFSYITYTVQRMLEIGAKLLLKSRLEPLLRVSEKSRVMDSLGSSQEKDQSCRQAGSRIDERVTRLTFSMPIAYTACCDQTYLNCFHELGIKYK